MGRKIAVDYDPQSFLGRWIDAHRTKPWFGAVPWSSNETTRARTLYETYREDAEDDDRAVASERDFGLTLQAAGFEPHRDEDGRYYVDIGVQSRAQRALHQARDEIMRPIIERHHADARTRHFAEVSHVRVDRDIHEGRLVEREFEVPCGHHALRDFLGASFAVPIWIAEGDEGAAEEIKSRAEEVEKEARLLVATWYQPLVDWRPGQPDPTARLVARRRLPDDRGRLMAIDAEIAANRPRLEALQAALPAYRAYLEREEQRLESAMREAYGHKPNLLERMTWAIDPKNHRAETKPTVERVDEYEISTLSSLIGRLADEATMLRPRIARDEAVLQG